MRDSEGANLTASKTGPPTGLGHSLVYLMLGSQENINNDAEADIHVVHQQPFVLAFLVLTVVSISFASTCMAGLSLFTDYPSYLKWFLAIAVAIGVSAIVWTLYRLIIATAGNRRKVKSVLIQSILRIPTTLLLLTLGIVFSAPIVITLIEDELEQIERETRFLAIYNAQAERLQLGGRESLYNYIQSYTQNQRASEVLIPNFQCIEYIRQSELIRSLKMRDAFSAAESCRKEIQIFEELAASGRLGEHEGYFSWAGDWNNPTLRFYYLQQIRELKFELAEFLRGFHQRGILHSISLSLSYFPEFSLSLGLMLALLFSFPAFTHLISNPSAQEFSRSETWRLYLSRDHGIHHDVTRLMSPSGAREPIDFYSMPEEVLRRELEKLRVNMSDSVQEQLK